MNAALDVSFDAGARIVSPTVELTQTPALGTRPTFATMDAAQERVVIGFGDGTLRVLPLASTGTGLNHVATLDNLPLTAATDVVGQRILIGTDAGTVLALADGRLEPVASVEKGWVNALSVHSGTGCWAFAAGPIVTILDSAGTVLNRADDHASTVTDLAFSPDGSWIAAAHYCGVQVWPTVGTGRTPVRLSWHGSHTAVSWSPDGKFIVTAMQDKEMHCWRWRDRKSMRMSGYPAKIRSLSWTADGRFVAAGGADTVTSWDCTGGGPSGRAPLEFGYVYNGTVRQVAAHPSRRVVAGGYSDGTVLIGEIELESAAIARPGDGEPIVALAWTADGETLVGVDDAGAVALMRMNGAMG